MRALVLAAFLALGLAAYACDSFDETPSEATLDASSPETGLPDAGALDTGVDQQSGCSGEPDWTTLASASRNATCDGAQVDLLTNSAHCGRCDHSCAPEGCVDGTCVEAQHDTGYAVPYAERGGALYYTRRGGAYREVMRLVAGSAPVVLGHLDTDAGPEKEILSLALGADVVYLRTSTALRRTSTTLASSGPPDLVTTLTTEDAETLELAAGADKILAPATKQSRIDAIAFDGGVAPFMDAATYPTETRLTNGRLVWVTQPFVVFGGAGNSIVWLHEGASDTKLLESTDHLGGLAVDGDEAFVIRTGTSGAIVAIDLTSHATKEVIQDAFFNPGVQLALTVDATHLYWVKALDGFGISGEIWKRARCGGAAVRIGKHQNIRRLVPMGGRLYIGASDGLYSIAK